MAKTKRTDVSKQFLQEYYNYGFEKLKKLFGDDWYVYKEGVYYALVVGNTELTFISLKYDFNGIVDGIATGYLLGKQAKKCD